ncbi:Brp/Blh family beta-carotene 15,15'-monooxygenase [Winogradskyella wandonensis]|uniref:Probable beta-carotene 15,15'-dioxygenase n=1 Tax=Winogradskyella wandonensis TaxID=1442586 RepID=A0A4R1KVA1_9FLAO|nr:Brp/Blh family beta-carotene 15,15'-dioxygenase [Winogradskyella wandonensis]TCK68623.1 Brp/Blh family beta-carotene 15,15'-monooxygenase [Winogradskyella wandonensis]
MRNIQNFKIVTTFLCLWLAVYLSDNLELYLASFFILTVGLLHGSNDIKIINHVFRDKKISFYKALFIYIAIVILGAVLFFFIPKLTLVFFILVSGFHFGEQHFHHSVFKNNLLKNLLFISYGCTIIFLLLFTNNSESIDIIKEITGKKVSLDMLTNSLLVSLIILALSAGLLYKDIKKPFKELFFLLVFYVVFKVATLFWAFAIYFVLWHSLPSLIDQIKYLSKDVNKLSLTNYIKSSFIYWLVSVVGLFVFLNFLFEETNSFYSIFFSFLAAITFPHVFVMSKIFKH